MNDRESYTPAVSDNYGKAASPLFRNTALAKDVQVSSAKAANFTTSSALNTATRPLWS